MMSHVTFVVPCFNEAARLPVAELKQYAQTDSQHRFLFVDDGSTDATWETLESLAESNSESFTLLRLPHNMGKAEAVRQGILKAVEDSPDYVGYWDADLATPLAAIPEFCRLLRERADIDMVIGSRVRLLGRDIDRRPMRHYLGRCFATAASCVLKLPVYDTQCGAKLFRVRPELVAMFQQPFATSWIFDVELLARYLQCLSPTDRRHVRTRICELPLVRWSDVDGSKLRARHYLRAVIDLMTVSWQYRARPYLCEWGLARRRPLTIPTGRTVAE